MKKPRGMRAQSVAEFIIIFAVVVVASIWLANNAPRIFDTYLNRANTAITEDTTESSSETANQTGE